MEGERSNFTEVRGQTESEGAARVTWEESRTHVLFVANPRASYKASEEAATCTVKGKNPGTWVPALGKTLRHHIFVAAEIKSFSRM